MLLRQLMDIVPLFTILELERLKPLCRNWSIDLLFQLLWDYITPREQHQRRRQGVLNPAQQPPIQRQGNWPRQQQIQCASPDQPQPQRPRFTGQLQQRPQQSGQPIGQRPPQQVRPRVPQPISSPKQFQPRSPCYFCQGNHLNDECHNFRTVQARKNKLMQLGRSVQHV